MTPRDAQGSTLSAQRAFVVHLSAGAGSGRRRLSGRVEHLSSGQSTHFSSLKGLLAFFATVLDAAGGPPIEPAPAVPGSGSLLRQARGRPAE
jgi:hypothetical protein